MMKDIQLFDYQEDMVKRVREAFRYHVLGAMTRIYEMKKIHGVEIKY